VLTSSYTIHLVASAKGERLRAKGFVLGSGRRQATVRADVFAETGSESRLVATALASISKAGR
jgi:acyl-coenzyme A thioesterase PaaI-like protein